MYQAERFPDVPHFIGKHAVETALQAFDVPFTILRPGYFFQNDAALKAPLTGPGLYSAPIGTAGICTGGCISMTVPAEPGDRRRRRPLLGRGQRRDR